MKLTFKPPEVHNTCIHSDVYNHACEECIKSSLRFNSIREEKIVLKYAKKYYPEDSRDWAERHRAIAMVAEILRDL